MKTFTLDQGAPLPLNLSAEDLPDPTVLVEPGAYYVYATNNARANVPVIASSDLHTFTFVGDALPTLPAWASAGFTWAPEVIRIGEEYVLYFTARLADSPWQVIGTATASHPEGPFEAQDAPLICMLDLGGAIDPDVLTTDTGERYLYWKNDGNAAHLPTRLWGALLTPDGLGLASEPVELLSASEPWERELVEAPQVIEDNGTFHLLYSCADFGNETYAVGHAHGEGPLGPFVKTIDAPLLASSDVMAGPGHSHAFRDARGQWRLAYHAWSVGAVGYPLGRRTLQFSSLHLTGRMAQVI
ncbi:glycoside hydrolase family 43 protein [Deinococcus maricopensis]|uniref:Glycoside hydrolase family 43 n=1 Tax=Deinococcus maricopensis (strain DSM 21211 / LMG 22137 / NRRL B-23946 / LB-34) TaxID=709986 RepID=E8U3D3_DEIML|nr:glycoside hydrolase family 43 protein [Deinococcus maricopensis]ADV65804.1 glycoside hydrolase family 43 [Deinococcus maricopensis DSM 21211]